MGRGVEDGAVGALPDGEGGEDFAVGGAEDDDVAGFAAGGEEDLVFDVDRQAGAPVALAGE